MRTRRVRLRPLREGTVRLRGGEAHHLARVLRAAPGDPVVAFDGEGREAAGEVALVEDAEVTLRLGPERAASTEAPLELTLAVALLKGDKLAQVVRQATELGAARLAPFVAPRSDLPRLSPNKLDRLRRVAAEAAKQCGRARVPEVEDPVPLARLAWDGPAWVADPRAGEGVAARVDALLAEGASTLTVITGPEGGFSEADVEALRSRGALPVGLGPRILRAETAPIAVAAALMARVDG